MKKIYHKVLCLLGKHNIWFSIMTGKLWCVRCGKDFSNDPKELKKLDKDMGKDWENF